MIQRTVRKVVKEEGERGGGRKDREDVAEATQGCEGVPLGTSSDSHLNGSGGWRYVCFSHSAWNAAIIARDHFILAIILSSTILSWDLFIFKFRCYRTPRGHDQPIMPISRRSRTYFIATTRKLCAIRLRVFIAPAKLEKMLADIRLANGDAETQAHK